MTSVSTKMLYKEVRKISLRSQKSQRRLKSRESGDPVKFKQFFLTKFNQKFLRPIFDCDSSPVHLNSLNDLDEIVLLLCIQKSDPWKLLSAVYCK